MIEIATIEFKLDVKDGELINNTPRLDILQDNLKEVLPLIPNGEYKWIFTMTTENAEKSNVEPTS